MNYGEIYNHVATGIQFFGNGQKHKFYTNQGTVEIVSGVEVEIARQSVEIEGVLRQAKKRDIDGEAIIAGDWLGFFGADTPIKKGYEVCLHGEHYVVVDERPVMPGGEILAYRPIMRRVTVHG